MRSDKPRKKKNSLFFTVLKAVLLAFALAATCFVLFFAVSLLKLDAWKEFDPENILGAPETLILYDKDDNEALMRRKTGFPFPFQRFQSMCVWRLFLRKTHGFMNIPGWI